MTNSVATMPGEPPPSWSSGLRAAQNALNFSATAISNFVAGGVTSGVVDPLQLVEIQKQHGERRALGPLISIISQRCSSRCTRFGSPVSASWTARKRMRSCAARDSAEITHHDHALPLASPVHVAHDVFDRDAVAIAMQREALIRQLGAGAHDLAHAGVLGAAAQSRSCVGRSSGRCRSRAGVAAAG